MQESKRQNRGNALAGNHPAVRHVGVQCERAKRALSSSTQATMEIDALLDGTDFPLAFSEARFKELNVEFLRNAKGPVERCLCDGGIDKRNVHDVIHVRGFTRCPIAQNVFQELCQWESIHQSRRSARFLLLDVTPLFMELERAGGVMTKLIERNRAVHTKKGQHIRTHADNQPDAVTPRV